MDCTAAPQQGRLQRFRPLCEERCNGRARPAIANGQLQVSRISTRTGRHGGRVMDQAAGLRLSASEASSVSPVAFRENPEKQF
jgi:hypothetical protein